MMRINRRVGSRTRLLAALAALSLAAVGSISPAVAGEKEGMCWPGETLDQCSGDLGHGLGKFDLRVPVNFNGTVLLFFHGIRFGRNTPILKSLKAVGINYDNDPAYNSVTIPGLGDAWIGNGKVDLAAGGSNDLANAMMKQGFAVAGLGYGDTQGWAVQEAYAAGQAMVKKLRSGYVYGERRVIVWGESMGTLPALKLAESMPQVSAAYAECVVPPSTQVTFQQALDALYVLKVLGGLDLKLTYDPGQAGLMEAYSDLGKVLSLLGAIKANANAVTSTKLLARNVVLLAGLIGGLPEASANYDGITTGGPFLASQLNTSAAMAENIGGAAVLATLLRFDVESRIRFAGGLATGSANFTDNVNTSYTDLLSDEQRAQYETFLNLGGTDVVDQMLGALDASKGDATMRYVANPAAVAAAKAVFPEYTGVARVPTMLVGYEVDPVTQAGQVARYVDRSVAGRAVSKRHHLPLAMAAYAAAPADGWTVLGDPAATAARRTSGIGHCGSASALTGPQHVALMSAFNQWLYAGDTTGLAAVNAVRYDTQLGFQADPEWLPAEVKY